MTDALQKAMLRTMRKKAARAAYPREREVAITSRLVNGIVRIRFTAPLLLKNRRWSKIAFIDFDGGPDDAIEVARQLWRAALKAKKAARS